MAVEMIGNVVAEDLVNRISSLTTLFQAIGGLIIAYIIFGIINMIHNWKKEKELRRMRQLLEQINKKLSER